MQENINLEAVEETVEAIRETQEAIKQTIDEKYAQHPAVLAAFMQAVQLKKIADLMEINNLEGLEDYEEEETGKE